MPSDHPPDSDKLPPERKSEMLPRLLYIGDVPVEHSYHGSALLYRLLQNYPPSKLLVVEVRFESEVTRRLPGVQYRTIKLPLQRMLTTRFNLFVSSTLAVWGGCSQSALLSGLGSFSPDAVLTVVHGYSWKAAAKFARSQGLPYHLIIHDDWDKTFSAAQVISPALHRHFTGVYRNAKSRLCVSPYMAQSYKEKYGSSGDYIYPSRAAGVTGFDTPSPRIEVSVCAFTVAFAGSINSPGYLRALKAVARALDRIGGRLAIFGPISAIEAEQNGLTGSCVQLKGLVSSDELGLRCRAEADVLLVPMSFAPQDKENMQLSFPSKLTDYTAIGLPILIWGPKYCSAVRWAAEHPGVAEVVDTDDFDILARSIAQLASDPTRRTSLARCALEIGKACFSHETAERKFLESVTRA